MSEDEKIPVASLGFKDRTNLVRVIPRDKDEGIGGWLRQLATICDKTEVESAVVVMCSKNHDCDFMMKVLNESHAALLALQMDDVYEDLKNEAFHNEVDLEDEGA